MEQVRVEGMGSPFGVRFEQEEIAHEKTCAKNHLFKMLKWFGEPSFCDMGLKGQGR